MSNVVRFNTQSQDLAVEQSGPQQPDATSLLNFRQLYGIMRRHFLMIGGCVALGTVGTTIWVNQITPIYQAQVEILVDPKHQTVTPFKSVEEAVNSDWTLMETQAAILRSRDLAVQAVKRLNMIADPRFSPTSQPPKPGLLAGLWAPVHDVIFGAAPKKTEPVVAPVPVDPQQRFDSLVDVYMGCLQAVPAQMARILYVRCTSADPKFAADAATMAAKVYIDDQITIRGQSNQSAVRYLSDRIEEQRAKLLAAERALEEFRAKAGIVDYGKNDASPITQQLTNLNTQLVEVRRQVAEAQIRSQQMQGMARGQGGLDASSVVMNNPFVAQLRGQESDLTRKLADLSTQLRENHPQIIALKNELRELRNKIAVEIGKVAGSTRQDYDAAVAREVSLTAEIKRIEALQGTRSDSEIKLRTLQAEVQTARQVYETLLSRFNEVSIADEQTKSADARVLQPARVPGAPISPRKDLITTLALFVSLAVGIALALIIELLDAGFRSVHQLEQLAGVPALGMVPFQTQRVRRSKRPWDTVLDKPNSAFSEAIRTIRTGLLLSSVDHPPRTVLVTSSVPGEGKTTTALALASAASASGQRTIIIDCDMRQPATHTNLGVRNTTGLSDYLTGNATLEQLIQIDDRSGLHYICAGGMPPSPTDLLGSNRMRQLLQQLSAAYHLVVLDTPPILAVSDALLLVRTVDKTLFVVRWERTRRDVALSGLKVVLDAGARVGGLVLTQVNLRKHALYDYSDSGAYYYRGYKRYYVE